VILAKVVSDLKNPRGDFRAISQGVQVPLNFNKGLLGEVIRDRLVSYRGEDEFPHPMVVLIMNSQQVHFATVPSLIAAGALGWTTATGGGRSFMAHKGLDAVAHDYVRAVFDFAGQFHGFQDLFRCEARCGSFFTVVLKTRYAVCRRRSPEADQERSSFVHETFPPY
jgi:hypothetical protein